MSPENQPSYFGRIVEKVHGDLRKAAFENLRNYTVIGLVLGGIKRSFVFPVWVPVLLILILFVPLSILLLDALAHTQMIWVLFLIGPTSFAKRGFSNEASFMDFFNGARWQFIGSILVCAAAPFCIVFIILAALK